MSSEVSYDKSKLSYVFSNTFKSLFDSKVILMFALSTLGVLTFWIAVGFTVWPSLYNWVSESSMHNPKWAEYLHQFEYLKSFDLVFIVLLLGLIFIAIPVVIVSATAVSSLISSTYLIQYLGQKSFPHLEKKGSSRLGASFWNLMKFTLIFLLLNFLLIPISWIFPTGPIFSWIAMAWYNQKIGSFDVLTMWANDQEFKTLRSNDNLKTHAISLIASTTAFVPFTFLIMPIIVNIALTHYYLARLQNLRRTTGAV